MTKVSLKVQNGNAVETVQQEIDEMNLLQFTQAVKIVKEIISTAQDSEELQAVVQDVFTMAQENQDQDVTQVGLMAMKKLMNASDVLLVEFPEQFIRLLSSVSGIDIDTLYEQKPEDVMDVYDAVLQENDIEKIVERGKKSFSLTKSQMNGINILANKANNTMKATTEATQQ